MPQVVEGRLVSRGLTWENVIPPLIVVAGASQEDSYSRYEGTLQQLLS